MSDGYDAKMPGVEMPDLETLDCGSALGLHPALSEGTGCLLQALAFAAWKHADQRRKGRRGVPYINHPIRVATLLWEAGGVRDAAVLTAALLHDTLEDTETTPDELDAGFGGTVLALVEEVSDDKSLPKATRKQLQVAHAAEHSYGAKLIKLGDKIDNVNDLIREPPVGWSLERIVTYVDWAEAVVAGLRGVNPSLEQVFDEMVIVARTKIANFDEAREDAGEDNALS